MKLKGKKIILSRTDSIGDVVLTLPVAGVLKQLHPDCEIIFLGNSYTKELLITCTHIDHIVEWNKLKNPADSIDALKALNADHIIHIFPKNEIARIAKLAGIPNRIGTTNRLYHWLYCNNLVKLSRKKSSLHEAQLNLKLIEPLGAKKLYDLSEIPGYYGLTRIKPLPRRISGFISTERFNLILHPKSKGSGREWGLANFCRLVELLPQDDFKIFITGTSAERDLIEKQSPLLKFPQVIDLTGKLTLSEFIGFISLADGLVASSTGPLHIAAALGKRAVGIYPPMRPLHPARWAPVGTNACHLVLDKDCSACRKKITCECMLSIKPEEVALKLTAR